MKKGLNKITGFFREVKEEILKCTRPSSGELKESIIVVVATMMILGCFILASDFVIKKIFEVVFKFNI